MSPKATPRTHASKTELLRVRNIRSQRHIVPVPPQNEGARTRSSDEPSSNVSAYMSIYVHAQASATSLHRTLNLSANKYYYYFSLAATQIMRTKIFSNLPNLNKGFFECPCQLTRCSAFKPIKAYELSFALHSPVGVLKDSWQGKFRDVFGFSKQKWVIWYN